MEQHTMGQYTLWNDEDFITGYTPSDVQRELINTWLTDIVSATRLKQLVALADTCMIAVSKEQPTYWYTLRYVLTLKKYGVEVKVEVEQDSPYERVRIVSTWVRAENLISKKEAPKKRAAM
jgi:hypothetical protein